MSAVLPAPTDTATWAAMGTTVTVQVNGPTALVAGARGRLDELERAWSRFRPDSDISRLNATRGLPVFVSSDTRLLVRHGVEAWRTTGGLCDPSVLDAVIAAGYDRTFCEISAGSADVERVTGVAVPGCAGIVIDDDLGCVTLPVGVGFDPGGIGKGLAADIVADWLLDHGADGAFVSVGGDIRMVGEPGVGDGWLIDVRPSPDEKRMVRVAVSCGAIACSTTQRRRWTVGDEVRHHAIDPRTGRPAITDAATVAVIAGDAWWAEAMATELLLTLREDRPRLVGSGAAVVLTRDGDLELLGTMKDYLR